MESHASCGWKLLNLSGSDYEVWSDVALSAETVRKYVVEFKVRRDIHGTVQERSSGGRQLVSNG